MESTEMRVLLQAIIDRLDTLIELNSELMEEDGEPEDTDTRTVKISKRDN